MPSLFEFALPAEPETLRQWAENCRALAAQVRLEAERDAQALEARAARYEAQAKPETATL